MTSRAASAVYVYCLVRAERRPTTKRSPRGLPGTGPVRALHVGDALWLLVADAPLARYAAEAIERGLKDLDWVAGRAMAHEAVIEHFARARAVVPLQLFTLFANDERAIAHVTGERRRLERLLDRVAGRQEWGVRVTLDERRAMERWQERIRGAPGARTARRGPTSGTKFLQTKKAERDVSREVAVDARRGADEIFTALTRDADDARRRTPSAEETQARLVLDAAFLVRVRRAERFQALVRRLGTRLANRGCRVTLTGPWPPYNFVGDQA